MNTRSRARIHRVPTTGTRSFLRALLLGAPVLPACTAEPVPVTVTARLDGTPLVGIEIAALPYDAARLLDSLAGASPDPRPSDTALEARLLTFVPPPATELGPAGRAWAATRDSAQRLADSLRTLDRGAPGYREAYGRFRALYRRLTERTGAREEVYRSVTAEARELAERAAAAADQLRAWETTAYAAFDSLATRALEGSGRAVRMDTTDATGRAELELAPGAWWLVVRVGDSLNPFVEHAWDVPIVVRGYSPLAVPVFDANARARWRH